MVQEIKAYMSGDNQIFSTREEAVRHDAELVLMPILGGNVGLVNDIMAKAKEVFEALGPLVVVPTYDLTEKHK